MNKNAFIADLVKLRLGICPACEGPLPPVAQRTREVTCSEACHCAWIEVLIQRHGETQEVTHLQTGVVYLVPSRLILERGITAADLPRFPMKGTPSITCPFCQRVSYNLNDIAQKYCGACHRFHNDPLPGGNP